MFGSMIVLLLFLVRLVVPFVLLILLGTIFGQRNRVNT